MKRLFLLMAALTALVAAGAAVAHLKSSDATVVSATLAATTVDRLQTRTVACEGGRTTIEISDARYTGTATSANPDLNGPAELRVHSVFNTTKKLGWVEGSLKVRGSDHRSNARFTAVNTSGTLDGWLNGRAGRAGVLGSLTGSFSKETGLSGQLGTGTGTNAALLISRIDCRAASKTRPSVFLTVRGQVDVLTPASISVKPGDGGASQACTIGDEKPSSRIALGDRVEMTCAQVGGAWVLKKVRERN